MPLPTRTGRWQQDVACLLAGQTLAAFGTALAQFAITWYLTLATESGVVMTLSIVFGMLPQAVISTFGGVLADRWNRRRLIVLAQTLITLPTAALALMMFAGLDDHGLIFGVLTIRSVGAGLRTPVVSAVVPQMVPGEQLLRVNGTLQTMQSAISLLSPIISAAALAASSIVLVLVADVVMSGIAVVLMLASPLPAPLLGAKSHWRAALISGLRYTRAHRFVRWVLTMAVVVVLLGAAPAYLVPLHIARAFGGDVWMLGGSQVAVGLGMASVSALAALLGRRLNLTALLLLSPIAFGVALLAIGLAPSVWVLFTAMFVAGAALSVANGLSATLIQERIQPAYLGRVLGLFGLALFAMPAGLIVFGPLADLVPLADLFIGAGVATLVVSGFVILRPAGRAAAREGLETRPLVTVEAER